MNKCLHNDTSETEVNINVSVNNGSENLKKNTATSGKLIIAVYLSIVYVYISCTCLSTRLE
jgi:hypothetical protein